YAASSWAVRCNYDCCPYYRCSWRGQECRERQYKRRVKRKIKRASPQDVRSTAKKRKKLWPSFPHQRDSSISSELGDNKADQEVEKITSDDEDLPHHFRFMEVKAPRDRDSQTKAERDAMIAAHVIVDNYYPPVSRKGYASWSSWIAAYDEYCMSHHGGFRKCASRSVDIYNRFICYRCKYGVHQEQRGQEKRNTNVNFTGCRARLDLALMNVVSPGEWPRHRFVIMNECRMHNHATESAGKKTGVKNIPNDGPVAHMVATPHDCNVSSEKIGGFMSEELGNWSNALLKLQNGGTAQSRPQTFANGILAKNASSMKHRG
ncbi:hypothetical protein JG687_00015584, partial [Phytophthora cactorum]